MKKSKDKETEIAEWMYECLEKEKLLYQEVVVYEIAEIFGKEYTYINHNGNLAIARKVLKEFRNLTENTVIWERVEKCWRKRDSIDEPAKRIVD